MTLTPRRTTAQVTVSHVVRLCTDHEVIRIHALWRVALMANDKTVGTAPVRPLPCEPVRKAQPSVNG